MKTSQYHLTSFTAILQLLWFKTTLQHQQVGVYKI